MSTNPRSDGQQKPPLTPEEMKERWRHLRIANKLRREELEATLLESADYGPYWGGSDAEPFVRLRDQSTAIWVSLSVAEDRKGGAKWPVWRTDHDLQRLRQASRICCAQNAYAQGLLRNLTNYVIGSGFKYKVATKSPKHRIAETEVADPAMAETRKKQKADQGRMADMIVAAAQEVIDDFCARNNINAEAAPVDVDENGAVDSAASTVEREAYWRVPRDGETFLRMFRHADGRIDVRFVGPEMIWGAPPGQGQKEGWFFGVKHVVTESGELDLGRVLAYYVRPRDISAILPADLEAGQDRMGGEEVAAADMIHIKDAWEDAEVSRGTPTFSFDMLEALTRAAKLQRNMSISSAVRAARAEVWKHATGTQAQIQALQNGPGARNVTDAYGAPQTENAVRPGSISRVPNGQEPVAFSQNTNIADHQMAAQGDLRQACSSVSAPEYMTGTTNEANFATASEAGTPFVLAAESEQAHFRSAFLRLMWRVIRWAVQCQKLPQEALKILDIEVGGREIKKNNEGELASARKANLDAKVVSPQAEIMKLGGDPHQVIADWKEWQEKMGQPEQPPQAPGANPPKPGEPQPQPKPLRESLFLGDGDVPFILIRDNAQLEAARKAIAAATSVGLDIETTGLDAGSGKVRLLSLAAGGDVFLIDCFAVDPSSLWQRLAAVELVIHHAPFDLGFLGKLGFSPGVVIDTCGLARVLSPDESNSLAACVQRELGRTLDKSLQASDWSGELTPAQLQYAATDAAVLLPLAAALEAKLRVACLRESAEWDEGKHKRASDGKFGSGGGSSKKTPDANKKHKEAKVKSAQTRDKAASTRAKAQETKDAIGEHVQGMWGEFDNIAFDSDANEHIAGLEQLVKDFDDTASPSEQFESLKEIEQAAKDAASDTEGIDAEYLADNQAAFKSIAAKAKEARGKLKELVQHHKDYMGLKDERDENRDAVSQTRQERVDAFNDAKEEANLADQDVMDHENELPDLFNENIVSDSDDAGQAVFSELDSAIGEQDSSASVQERYANLQRIEKLAGAAKSVKQPLTKTPEAKQRSEEINAEVSKIYKKLDEIYKKRAKLKAAGDQEGVRQNIAEQDALTARKGELDTEFDKLEMDDGFSESEIAKNHSALDKIVRTCKRARKGIKAYVGHRKTMQRLKSGDVSESLTHSDFTDWTRLLESWDESKHSRSDDGKFGSGGSDKKTEPKKDAEPAKATDDKPAGKSKSGAAAAIAGAIGVSAAAYHVLHEAGSEAFHSLPEPVQAVVTKSIAAAFSGWTASQSLAERISKEKGSTPEEAAKLRSTLAAWDLVAFKPMSIATAPMGGAIAAATWIVPPVTGAYLLHSTVRHPLATFRAAAAMVKDAVGAAKKWLDDHTDVIEGKASPTAAQQALADALERNGYDDWYTAILHAAIQQTKNAGHAIKIADDVFKANPKDESKPQADDADAMFGAK